MQTFTDVTFIDEAIVKMLLIIPSFTISLK